MSILPNFLIINYLTRIIVLNKHETTTWVVNLLDLKWSLIYFFCLITFFILKLWLQKFWGIFFTSSLKLKSIMANINFTVIQILVR